MKNKNFLFKKLAIIIMLITTFLFFTNLSITADGDHNKTIQEVIKEIRNELNLKSNDKIDPDKVSERLLEELGEAVMNEIHPNENEHEWMDDMMGGEGSTSLRSMHIAMGYRYLEGSYNNVYGRHNNWRRGYGRHMMMAPFSMMGSGRNYRFPGNFKNRFFNFRWIGGITMIIFWLVILGLIGYLIYAAVTKNTKSNNQEESSLDIIKKRYALGEITKKEYEEKKKDIL